MHKPNLICSAFDDLVVPNPLFKTCRRLNPLSSFLLIGFAMFDKIRNCHFSVAGYYYYSFSLA
jgi:hypothetical protein